MYLEVSENAEVLGRKAAEKTHAVLSETIARQGSARLMLATGQSHFAFYEALRTLPLAWEKIDIFHLDEYVGIPRSHRASFSGYLYQRFIDHIAPRNFYAIDGTAPVAESLAYLNAKIAEAPLDLGTIGIGDNGHIAFNDPPADFAITDGYHVVDLDTACRTQQVNEGWFPDFASVPQQAISATVQAILGCRVIVSNVPHAAKAQAVYNTLTAAAPDPMIPATALLNHAGMVSLSRPQLGIAAKGSRRPPAADPNATPHGLLPPCLVFLPSPRGEGPGVRCRRSAPHSHENRPLFFRIKQMLAGNQVKGSAPSGTSNPIAIQEVVPWWNRSAFRENMAAWIFLLPSLIGFVLFIAFPIVSSFLLSFADWNFLSGLKGIQFAGLANFQALLSGSDEWFVKSIINTFLFALITVPIGLGLGLVCAVLINRYVYASTAFRVLVFIPYVASVVASAVVWQVVFQPSYGPVNAFLMSIGIENPPRWFTDLNWAFPTIMAFHIWQTVGYNVIVFMAGLKGIPPEIYEAARMDGASEMQQFRFITVPMISATTFFLSVMGVIGTFKVFDSIKVLTNGGPGNATTVIAFYIYREAFTFYNMGTANAAAWIMFLAIFVVTLIQMRQQSRWVTYD